MRGSLVTSAVFHALVLVAALVTIGAPKSFEVQDVEALPVDIVPVESISQMQQGDRKAPLKDKSNTKPTTKQTQVANAENTGENEVDLKTPPTPVTKPADVQATAAPKPTEVPQPKVDPKPNDVKTIEKQETDTPPPPKETASIPQPKPEVTPPVPTPTPPQPPAPTQQTSEQQPTEQAAPDSVPLPELKPQPPQPQKPIEKPLEKPVETKAAAKPADKKPDQTEIAQKAPDPDKKKDDKKRETAKSASSKDSDFNADEISALLNKQQAAGGGAKRSTEVASLGGKKNTGGTKLTQSEMDAIKGQIENNWSVVAGLTGASDVRIKVTVNLDQAGNIVGDPEVSVSGGPEGTRQALGSSAYRAVLKSAPLKNLPRDKYDGTNGWNQLVLNFDPTDLGL